MLHCSLCNKYNKISNRFWTVFLCKCHLMQQQSLLCAVKGLPLLQDQSPNRKCYDESNFHRDSSACSPADWPVISPKCAITWDTVSDCDQKSQNRHFPAFRNHKTLNHGENSNGPGCSLGQDEASHRLTPHKKSLRIHNLVTNEVSLSNCQTGIMGSRWLFMEKKRSYRYSLTHHFAICVNSAIMCPVHRRLRSRYQHSSSCPSVEIISFSEQKKQKKQEDLI